MGSLKVQISLNSVRTSKSEKHGVVWVGRDLKYQLVPPPATGKAFSMRDHVAVENYANLQLGAVFMIPYI